MKSLLICPDERRGVAVLAGSAPISNVPILGNSLLEYWLAHLVTLGAQDVVVLASDRPDQVRAGLGDGARWGLRVSVLPQKTELTADEARAQHKANDLATWLAEPNDVILVDHLPSLPDIPLVGTYADWVAAAQALMPRALTPDRIGVHELKPGVWIGLHAHIAPDAKLIAPCWIGERAWVEAGAVIGPDAVLEKEALVARGAEVSQSVIGPQTFVGQFTEVRDSIAWGSVLVNWKRDSCLKVPDEFLLCSLEPHRALPVPAKSPARVGPREYVRQLLTRAFVEFVPPR